MQWKLVVPLAMASVAIGAPTDKHGLTKRDPDCLRRGGTWSLCSLQERDLGLNTGGSPTSFTGAGTSNVDDVQTNPARGNDPSNPNWTQPGIRSDPGQNQYQSVPGDQSRTVQDYAYQGVPQEEPKEKKSNFWDGILGALAQLGQLGNTEQPQDDYYANSNAGGYYGNEGSYPGGYANNGLSEYQVQPQGLPSGRGYMFRPPGKSA